MKFLIVKTSSLGDILHAFPFAQYLREKFPRARIDWLVEKEGADLLKGFCCIDEVFCINTKLWKRSKWQKETLREVYAFLGKIRKIEYDCIFDLQGNTKSGVLVFLAKGRCKVGFGRRSVSEYPNIFFTNKRYELPERKNIREDLLYLGRRHYGDFSSYESGRTLLKISQEEERLVSKLCKELISSNSPSIMICPGSVWKNKQMSVSSWTLFLEELVSAMDCFFIFIWGTKEERNLASVLQENFSKNSFILDRLRLPVLQRFMSRVDCIISMDSLPLHLCGTVKTPSYSIFGPSSLKKYNPLGEIHGGFQATCPYGEKFEKRCRFLRSCSTGLCLKSLNVKEMLSSFKKWYARRRFNSRI